MRDDDRQPGRRQLEHRAAEVQVLRDVVIAAVMYGGAILATALLAILLIATLEGLGIWSSVHAEATSFQVADHEAEPRRISTWARWATRLVGA